MKHSIPLTCLMVLLPLLIPVRGFTASEINSKVINSDVIKAIPDGSYLGEFRGSRSGPVSMIAQSYPGCDSCFIAVFLVAPGGLFESNKTPELVVYSAVPRVSVKVGKKQETTDTYDLSPFALSEGKLTLPVADPALILQVDHNSGSENVHFSIVKANEVNKMGLQAGMIFVRERESPFHLSSPKPGHYYQFRGHRKNFLDFGTVVFNPTDHAQSVRALWTGDQTFHRGGGVYVLREQARSVFSFTRISSLAIGDIEGAQVSFEKDGKTYFEFQRVPDFITLFFKKRSQEMALMVNPHQSVDVRRYDFEDEEQEASVAGEDVAISELLPPTGDALAQASSTQTVTPSWVYPGGPEARVTAKEIAALSEWTENAKVEINRVLRDMSTVTSDETRKNLLVTRLERLAGKMDLSQKDLLMRQSLYAGLSLVKILDLANQMRGASPGVMSAEVNILERAANLALRYYLTDQKYQQALQDNDPSVRFNDKMLEFGSELSEYIASMSVTMRPLNLLGSYGALRWNLDVLERKIFDDPVGRTRLGIVIGDMNQKLKAFPQFDEIGSNSSVSDIDVAVRLLQLRKVYEFTRQDVQSAIQDIKK